MQRSSGICVNVINVINVISLVVIGIVSSLVVFAGCGPARDRSVKPLAHAAKADTAAARACTSALEALRQDPRRLVGQLLWIHHSSSCDVIDDLQPGGVFYYGYQLSTAAELALDNSQVQQCARQRGVAVPLLTATNHEGGRIHFFDEGGGVSWFPSAREQCHAGADNVYRVSKQQAGELSAAGLNATFGPVADVLLEPTSTVIGDRAYAADPARAAACVERAVDGYHDGGLLAVLKHFPGHGGTAADTHLGLAVDHASAADLRDKHLVPFVAGLTAPTGAAEMVMVSHVIFDRVDASWPATLSAPVIDLLKHDLLQPDQSAPFEGVAVTDDLMMKAVHGRWGIATVSILALMAGNDMLLVGTHEEAAASRDALVEALERGFAAVVRDVAEQWVFVHHEPEAIRERIEDAVSRVLRIKHRAGLCCDDTEEQ